MGALENHFRENRMFQKQLGLQPKQMVQNEKWESNANEIRFLAMVAPWEHASVWAKYEFFSADPTF